MSGDLIDRLLGPGPSLGDEAADRILRAVERGDLEAAELALEGADLGAPPGGVDVDHPDYFDFFWDEGDR